MNAPLPEIPSVRESFNAVDIIFENRFRYETALLPSVHPHQLTKLFETILSRIPLPHIDYPYFAPMYSRFIEFNEVAGYFLVRILPRKKKGSSSFSMGRRRKRGERGKTPWRGRKKKGREREIITRGWVSWLTVGQISSGLIASTKRWWQKDGRRFPVGGDNYLRRTRFPFEYPWINYRPSLSDRFVSIGEGGKGLLLYIRVCSFVYKLFVCV